MQIINPSGAILELAGGSSITVERQNSLFNEDDTLLQDLTYQGNAGLTPSNQVFIESGHLVEAKKEVYEIPVQVFNSGYQFYNALFTYEINGDQIAYILKINLGAIVQQLKSTLMNELFTNDAVNTAITPAFMKSVCENPENYPYSFFPVYCQAEDPSSGASEFMINSWDVATGTFTKSPDTAGDGVNSVYWKLTHYLRKLAEYLSLTITGSYLDDPENDQIYVHNKMAMGNLIYGSTAYLPQTLTIIDFLKVCKSRFKISFAPDLLRGTVSIDQGRSLLKSTKVNDLSAFVTSIDKIAPPAQKGYTVTLVPDESDDAWMDPLNEGKYIPTNKLVIGTGEKEVSIECSTLKEKVLPGYTLPFTMQPMRFNFYGAEESGQLRFLRYSGMQTLSNGKKFPRAYPMELEMVDSTWYRFLNAAKPLKLTLHIPATVLATLDTSEKIGVISEQGTDIIAICSKITYPMGEDDPDLIKTVIECASFGDADDSRVDLIPFISALEEDDERPFFKAFFNEQVSGLNQIHFEVYYEKKRTGDSASIGSPFTHTDVIVNSTDKHAAGGSKTFIPYVSTVRDSIKELRIRNGVPQYAVKNGLKIPFIKREDYYYANNAVLAANGQGIWIVF